MADLAATLNGNRVTKARITIPKWGAWFADVQIDSEQKLSGAATLVVADKTFSGYVLSGGADQGVTNVRIVGGKGGWGKTIANKSYANDAGVKLRTVLRDAADAAGEVFDESTLSDSVRIGPAYVRKRGPASRSLELLVPGAWYVGEDGKTRLGARTTKAYAGTAQRTTNVDYAQGRVTLAPQTSLEGLAPGATFDSLEAIDVVIDFSKAEGLRVTCYGKQGVATGDRRIDALRAIMEQLDPNRAYRAVYEYRVVTRSSKRVDVQPVLRSSGMPDLQRVPIWPGVSGARSDVTLGSRVLVGFVNADPARPFVAAVEDADGEGFIPEETIIRAPTVKLGGASTAGVVQATTLAPLLTALSAHTTALNAYQTLMQAFLATINPATATTDSGTALGALTGGNAAVVAAHTALTTALASTTPYVSTTVKASA